MGVSVFHNVVLKAVSTTVPATAVTTADELRFYNDDPQKASKFTEVSGLQSRRVASEECTASDLCLQAAENLFRETGIDRSSIDALVFVSHTPDYQLPATATILQDTLGLSQDCATMDMNVGCAGFLNGLWVGAGLIASGACKRFLLLTGDTPNRFQDQTNRVIAPVFGDAGTAALLERDEKAEPMSFLLGSNGKSFDVLGIPGGGSRIPHLDGETAESPINRTVCDRQGNPWTLGAYGRLWMDGLAVYSFTMSVVPRHIKRHLEERGLETHGLDWLFLHQANKIVVQGIGKKLGIEEARVPYGTLKDYGNLGAMSIPAQLCESFADGSQSPKDKVMLCSFGAGLAWASCLLSLEGCRFLPICDYHEGNGAMNRQDRIDHWHKKFERHGK